MTDQDEANVYTDLLGFLQSDRTDVRVAAIDAVLAVKDKYVFAFSFVAGFFRTIEQRLTGFSRLFSLSLFLSLVCVCHSFRRNGMSKLIQHGIVVPLTKSCSYPDPIGVKALQALVNLSSIGPTASQCVEDLINAGALGRMTEICLSKKESGNESWNQKVNFAMGLLVNMTRTERGAVELVGRSLPDTAVSTPIEKSKQSPQPTKPTLELLLARFLSSSHYVGDFDYQEYDPDHATAMDSSDHDPYQHFAAVLMNSTQTEAGRQFVMRIHSQERIATSVLQAILAELRSLNPVRRRGIAGTLKNCCLESDSGWWLLHEIGITKHLLYPLAGPEELDVDEKRGLDPDLWLEGPDKVREPDFLTRLYCVEAILLLCASGRASRKTLRLHRVYVILKWADMVEEKEVVSERINECVQFLRRDEEGTYEGSSDNVMEDVLQEKSQALPVSSSAAQITNNADYDDVD